MSTHPVSHKAPKVATNAPETPLRNIHTANGHPCNCQYPPSAPIPEIEIRRVAHYWAIIIGHVVRSTPFFETTDPFRVCKWIKKQTNGEVNVIVNL